MTRKISDLTSNNIHYKIIFKHEQESEKFGMNPYHAYVPIYHNTQCIVRYDDVLCSIVQ